MLGGLNFTVLELLEHGLHLLLKLCYSTLELFEHLLDLRHLFINQLLQ
jgi:hypothetical protein